MQAAPPAAAGEPESSLLGLGRILEAAALSPRLAQVARAPEMQVEAAMEMEVEGGDDGAPGAAAGAVFCYGSRPMRNLLRAAPCKKAGQPYKTSRSENFCHLEKVP